ncbi:MAG: hypothetical protein EBZ59_09995, partial [Planctomycetia bacterium]|nr:hypothetical protein [Planctomycetia bacterium]
RRLAEASLRRDPDNPEAAIIREVSQRQTVSEREPEPIDVAPPAGREGAPEELAELQAMRRVRGQQLERETAVRIREARDLLPTDPDRARDLLKESQMLVSRSEDLDAADRNRLLSQLETRIREAIVRSREKVDRDLAAERRAAIGRERMRLNDELRRREERLKQLVERYNALVDEGIRDGYAGSERYPKSLSNERADGYEVPTQALTEAERHVGDEIGKEAPQLWSGHPIPMPARELGRTAGLVARTLDYDAENFRTRRDQERGFMDSLHLVDVAGIPLPDEPSIIYPTASRWREINALRAEYRKSALNTLNTNEQSIYDALDKPVGVNFSFEERSLSDLATVIQDQFGIPVSIDTRKVVDEAGLDINEGIVSRRTGTASLRAALRQILAPLELTYMVKNETLVITTKDASIEPQNMVVRPYAVGDLVLPVSPMNSVNPFNLGGTNPQGQNAGAAAPGPAVGPMCWVAREVYGPHDARWIVFREWLVTEAWAWLRIAYAAHGPDVAEWLRGRPAARAALRELMDLVVEPRLHPALPPAGHLQVADAKARLARSTVRNAKTVESAEGPADPPQVDDPAGLPAEVLDAADVRAAVRRYLSGQGRDGTGGGTADDADRRAVALRLAQVRISASDLGKSGDYGRAADVISAAIAAGRAEPWMYESLALALEAAGRPREEIERVLLSSADFAGSPVELLQLATYLARFDFDRHALRMCRRVARLDPASREAYALALTLAAKADDASALRWACAGVLSHDWPEAQQTIANRAARLAKGTIESLTQAGKAAEAAAFKAEIDAALVRDLVLELAWSGDADIDLIVEEPPGTVCSSLSPRSASGGILLTDRAAAEGDAGVHRERYVVAQGFPGTYRALVRRACGKVEADTVTAETIVHRPRAASDQADSPRGRRVADRGHRRVRPAPRTAARRTGRPGRRPAARGRPNRADPATGHARQSRGRRIDECQSRRQRRHDAARTAVLPRQSSRLPARDHDPARRPQPLGAGGRLPRPQVCPRDMHAFFFRDRTGHDILVFGGLWRRHGWWWHG